MRRFVSVALIVVGLGLMMIGLLAGLFYLGLPVVSTNANYDLLQINTVAVSVLAVGGVAGAMLAWVGWRRYTGDGIVRPYAGAPTAITSNAATDLVMTLGFKF